jgi:hypothetical protein
VSDGVLKNGEDNHSLWAVCDCLFNIFTGTPISGGCFLCPQFEDMIFGGDKGPTKNFFLFESRVLRRIFASRNKKVKGRWGKLLKELRNLYFFSEYC